MTDIKVILTEKNGWRALYEKCEDFFKNLRNQQSMAKEGKAIFPIFSVYPTATVVTAMVR
jgi:hypothetical protein